MKSLFKESVICSTCLDWKGSISARQVLGVLDEICFQLKLKPKIWLASGVECGNIKGEKHIRHEIESGRQVYDLTIRNRNLENISFWDFSLIFFDSKQSGNEKSLSVLQMAINSDRYKIDMDVFSDRVQTLVDANAYFTYGYAFVTNYENNVENYGPGMALGGIYDEKREDNSKWYYNLLSSADHQARNEHRLGKQRFPYSINYLSENHLSKKIDGIKFIDWIERSNGLLGVVEKIGLNLWKWRLNSEQQMQILNHPQIKNIFLSIEQ